MTYTGLSTGHVLSKNGDETLFSGTSWADGCTIQRRQVTSDK